MGECSTPFGDIDGCTAKALSSRSTIFCAQRLSATLMDAPCAPQSLATHGLQAPLFKHVSNVGRPDSLAEFGGRQEVLMLL